MILPGTGGSDNNNRTKNPSAFQGQLSAMLMQTPYHPIMNL